MSYPDPPGNPEPSPRDVRYGRHRARHADAAPEAYPAGDAYRYGDGESAQPLYAGEPGAGPGRRPGPGAPAAASGRGTPVAWPPRAERHDGGRTAAGHPAPGYPGPATGYPGPVTGPADRSPAPDRPARGDRSERDRRPGADRPGLPPVSPGLPSATPGRPPGTTARPPGTSGRPAGRPPTVSGRPAPGDGGPTREVPVVAPPAPRKSRAGRNLPAAIGVGLLLGAIVLCSLFLWRPAFVLVMAVAAGIGTWEMVRAVHSPGARPPLVPLLAGCAAMGGLAWYGGPEGLTVALVLTVVTVLIWHLGEGPAGYLRDVSAGTMIAVYVPFLLSFAILLAKPEDGQWRVLVTLAAVVLSDTGGYAVGVFLGRHKMAPSISPGKSWEGFAGSLAATAIGCALLLYFLFDVPWWHGAVLGVAVSAAAVVGDLTESMIKRDLGVKDMSNLLPGHGGLMDRLDSVVLAAPVAYVLLSVLAPVS